MTPHLSLGGEVFWAGQHRKSGIGYAGRYETDKMVITSFVNPIINIFIFCLMADNVEKEIGSILLFFFFLDQKLLGFY